MLTDEQKNWIVFEQEKEQYPAPLRRKFLIKYSIKGRKVTLYQTHLFNRVVEEFKKKRIEKVMCWAAVVNGRVLSIDAGTSVNSDAYPSLLRENLWPEMKSLASRWKYFFQQDGAPCHCANQCQEFLQPKLQGRVISRRTPIFWPAHSPDLGPLDYWFWGAIKKNVGWYQPESLSQLKTVVETWQAALMKLKFAARLKM